MYALKNTIACVLATLTFLNASAFAGDSPNLAPEDTRALIELLKSCDVALESCRKANLDKDALIAAQQRTIEAQAAQVTELRESQSSILKSEVLWFAIGMLTAGVTVYLVKQPAQ